LDKPPLPDAVREQANASIDMDQLRPSLPVSLLPFATAWIARTRLASVPVAFYAGLYVCIDIAYNFFEREVLAHAIAQISLKMRRTARRRSLIVLAGFAAATLVAFVAPLVAFALICCALILHVRPEAPWSRPRRVGPT